MKTLIYRLWQCTWGFLQTLLGFVVFLQHYKDKHFWYHGALITVWEDKASVSLGLFVFVTEEPFFAKKYEGQISVEELSDRLLVHEYGHTIQSCILGPLYLPVIGIPSFCWANTPHFERNRRMGRYRYSDFYPEKWANYLGWRFTGREGIRH